MSLANLLVGLKLGQPNRAALAMAGALAERFGSRAIGVAACRPIQAVCFDHSILPRLFEEDRNLAAREQQTAEVEFTTALHSRTNRLEWRPCITMTPLARHLAREARSADLVIIESEGTGPPVDKTRHIGVCDLVMHAGRPVLVVPEVQSNGRLDNVVVAWKDTRESRRALLDALPLLGRAKEISVAGIASQAELCDVRLQLDQVIKWLGHHGIEAQAMAVASRGAHEQDLNAIAQDQRADLVVAGACGDVHGLESVPGGVTGDLLKRAERWVLFSH